MNRKFMTPEEKQILLQDLSARLPYGVKISKANVIYPMTGINIALGYVELAVSERISIEDVKPYLRPLSSLTYEEIEELDEMAFDTSTGSFRYYVHLFPNFIGFLATKKFDKEICSDDVRGIDLKDVLPYIGWLNAHHIDYCGLIEMGLALEAPKGMYDFK